MSAHTPGPWHVRDLNDDFGKNAPQIATLADADGFGKPIASVCYLSELEREANARLIAAAPSGYRTACDVYLALLQLGGVWRIKNQAAYCKLRDYIAAASGRDAEEVQCDFEARAAAELRGAV